MSRDPIWERGGLHLFGFVGNGPVQSMDAIGEAIQIVNPPTGTLPGNGVTYCDPTGSDVHSWVVEWGECKENSVRRHENVHAAQLVDCCPLYEKCRNQLGVDKCHAAYVKWRDKMIALLECAAYKAEAQCWQDVADGAQCPILPEHPPGTRDPKCMCCFRMNFMLDPEFGGSSVTRRDKYCAEAEGKQLDPCPFDKDGGIKKPYGGGGPQNPDARHGGN